MAEWVRALACAGDQTVRVGWDGVNSVFLSNQFRSGWDATKPTKAVFTHTYAG